MQNEDFIIQQQRAIERMMEMKGRIPKTGTANMPPTPPFVKIQNTDAKADINFPEKNAEKENSLPFNFPIIGDIKLNRDTTLILGLLLLLYSEKADRLLLMALLYILL